MALSQINLGLVPNDGTGDPLRDAFSKTNAGLSQIDLLTDAVDKINTQAVDITEEADFPSPVGGVIQLEAETTYRVHGQVTVTNFLVMGVNTSIIGDINVSSRLIFLGASGALFTAINQRLYIKDLGVIVVNPAASVINKSGAEFCAFRNFFIQAAGSLGYIESDNDIIFSQGFVSVNGTCFTLGANQVANYYELSGMRIVQSSANPILDVSGATVIDGVFSECQAIPAGNGVIVKGDANSVNVNGKFVVRNNDFQLAFGQAYLDTVMVGDLNWNFEPSNEGIGVKASIFLGTALLAGNTTLTALTQNIPASIGGTFIAGQFDQRTLVQGAGGRIDNLSGGIVTPRVAATGTIDNAGGGTQTFLFEFYLNGVLVPNIRTAVTVDGNDNNGWSLGGDIEMGVSEYLEIMVTNTTGNQDCVVGDMQFIIRG